MMDALWTTSKAADANLVVCQGCMWHGDTTHPYWGLRQLKHLHESGSGHTVIYGRWYFDSTESSKDGGK